MGVRARARAVRVSESGITDDAWACECGCISSVRASMRAWSRRSWTSCGRRWRRGCRGAGRRRRKKGLRPWVDDRGVLNEIPYVLRTGIRWWLLPTEPGWGSGVTCWGRLCERQRHGVLKRLHQVALERLAAADRIHWTPANLGSRSLAAKRGRLRPEPDREGQSRLKAPPRRRPAGRPALRGGNRRPLRH